VGLERGPTSLVRQIEEILELKVAVPVKKTELTTGGICCADHATPSIRKKLALTSPTSGGRSVGIVRLRTEGHGVILLFVIYEKIYFGSVAQQRIERKENRHYCVNICFYSFLVVSLHVSTLFLGHLQASTNTI
jgi:hypothetical protein